MEQGLEITRIEFGHGTRVEIIRIEFGHGTRVEIIRIEFGHGTGARNNQNRVWTWNRD